MEFACHTYKVKYFLFGHRIQNEQEISILPWITEVVNQF